MKKIKVIELGGTISAAGNDRLDLKDYISGNFTGDTFKEDIPEIATIADVTFESFLRVSSTAIRTEHWIELREKVIADLVHDDFDGIVITHGTNTLEETAYFLHLTVPTSKPIVLVGAQRPYTALSTDAHYNLLQAIRIAASEEAHGFGVLVALNDEISSAREASKTNTYRLEAFQSGQLGFLGYVDPDKKVHLYRKPTKKHTINSEFATMDFDDLPEVEIIYSYAGASGHLIDAVSKNEAYKGIVTAGTGAGLISPDELAALERASDRGLVILRSSRVGNGRVMDVAPYENQPFLAADNLLPQKARILLMLALGKYGNQGVLQRIFDEY